MDFLNHWAASKAKVLLTCIVLSSLLHSAFMDLPPQSIHVWRQCNTLAVARNLYEEDMNPLQPRVDQRFDTNGVTGMQFPAYEFLVALGYKLVGFHNFVHRCVSFCAFMLGAWGIYELFFLLFRNPWAAALGAWSFCWSPELFYFGISALPDVLALSASLWGLVLFLKWYEGGNNAWLALSWPLCVLAGLTKIQFLAIGFPMAALVLVNGRKWNKAQWMVFILYGISCAGMVLAWYVYAVRLIHSTGLADFGLEFKPANGFLTGLKIFWHNLHSEIPELILNYATFVFFLVGIVSLVKDDGLRRSAWYYPLAAWGAAVCGYYFVELGQMGAHSYYLLPFLPLLLMVTVRGALVVKDSRWRPIFLTLLLLQPILAFFRIVPPRFWSKNKAVPLELYNEESRYKLEDAVPNNKLCVVGADNSRAIYFYFLHKKGFGFNQAADLVVSSNGVPLIEQYIRRGGQYLYTDDPSTEKTKGLGPYLKSEVLEEGNFKVFKLGLPDTKNGESSTIDKNT